MDYHLAAGHRVAPPARFDLQDQVVKVDCVVLVDGALELFRENQVEVPAWAGQECGATLRRRNLELAVSDVFSTGLSALERFHDCCRQVTTVTEPRGGVVGNCCFQCFGDSFVPLFSASAVPGLGGAQELFEFRPSLFDRVQVWRIGWQINWLCTAGLDQLLYSGHLVRA
jgi:hypothetical protein